MKCEKFSEIDLTIIERARYFNVKWPANDEHDQVNFVEFVKGFALDVIHDSSIQKQLLTPSEE